MAETQGWYVGVMMLYKSPIDKIAGKVLVERRQGSLLPIVGFWSEKECPNEQLLEWEKQGIFAIDLGGEKYNRPENQVGSATEFVAKRLGLNLSGPEQELLRILARNNKSGYLKSFHMAMSWTIRELYELNYDHREAVERMGHVIHSWLQTEEGGCDPARKGTEMPLCFSELLKETEKCNYAPFTPGRYLRDLWQLGYPETEIQERVLFWINGWKKAQQAKEEAEREFSMMPKKEFLVNGFRGLIIETSSSFIVKVASQKCDLLLLRSTEGHVSLMTRQLDLNALANIVKQREPDRWYYQVSSGMLMNGGKIYIGVPPTTLTNEELVTLIQQFPPRRRQPNGARQYVRR